MTTRTIGPLEQLEVLVVDCQSSGATPAHGDLLELGWAVSDGACDVRAARAEWIRPTSNRPVPHAIRKLTGWDPKALADSVEALDSWRRLLAAVPRAPAPIPTVIHFARFELPFLRDLHRRSDRADEPFPLDVVCLHAVSERLFPDLPRRNIRALSGYLGHSPELLRRSKSHVEASAFVWRALLPRLAERSVRTWKDLQAWLEAPASSRRIRGARRSFPLSASVRRGLPDAPGVYRFLRSNGDVLYVGKAASVKKRVASHFTSGRATERSLEMLSQVGGVDVTETPTPLEAALLETDEIKRLDPPYNHQLRAAERAAWFATNDWSHTSPSVDEAHRVGPLPSQHSVAGIAAVRALLCGASETAGLRAAAVGVPVAFGPDADLFRRAFGAFVSAELAGAAPLRTRILSASSRLIVSPSPEGEEAPSGWDLATVRRYLERVVVAQGTWVRRGRLLAILSEARIVYREPGASHARFLALQDGHVVTRRDFDASDSTVLAAPFRFPSRERRLAAFDAARYDRMRVLATELRRIRDGGGVVDILVSGHVVRPFGAADHVAEGAVSPRPGEWNVAGPP